MKKTLVALVALVALASSFSAAAVESTVADSAKDFRTFQNYSPGGWRYEGRWHHNSTTYPLSWNTVASYWSWPGAGSGLILNKTGHVYNASTGNWETVATDEYIAGGKPWLAAPQYAWTANRSSGTWKLYGWALGIPTYSLGPTNVSVWRNNAIVATFTVPTVGTNTSLFTVITGVAYGDNLSVSYRNTTAGQGVVQTRLQFVAVDDAPDWSSPSKNSSGANMTTQYAASWADESLANYTFAFDNGTGTFANGSTIPFTGTTNTSTAVRFVNTTPGSTIRWYFCAEDTFGQGNCTGVQSYTSKDLTIPQFSQASANTTGAGHPAKFSVLWENYALANYTFELDNGNGTPYNTTGTLTGATDWSNETRTLNSTVGSTIKWRFWAQDLEGITNATPQYSFTAADIDLPEVSGMAHNGTETGSAILLTATATDVQGLASYEVEIDSGNHTPYNVTGSLTGTSDTISVGTVLTTFNETAYWRAWAFDVNGNPSVPVTDSFTVTGTPVPYRYQNINISEEVGTSIIVITKGSAQVVAGTVDKALGNDLTGIVVVGLILVAAAFITATGKTAVSATRRIF